jgi:hypothetical protein
MGRGLSELQKTILRMAAANEDDPHVKYSVSYAEVLRDYYGWQPEKGHHAWNKDGTKGHGWGFSKARIGEKEYRSARAALSRAATRLYERGLVEYVDHVLTNVTTGVCLTEEGREETLRLSVNSRHK